MAFETCPLLNDIPWIKHGFFDSEQALTFVKHGIRTDTPYPALLGLPETPILFLKQVRADTIITPEAANDPDTQADAIISDRSGLGLAVATADCVPLFLVCTKTKQIANVHAGWQGTLLSITTQSVQKMIANGADPQQMVAALGPSIHAETYPVQSDVRDQFATERPETLDYFKPFEDRWCMDIPSMVKDELKHIGITQIWQSPTNVFTDTKYCSYRRRHTDPNCVNRWNASVIIKTGE